MLPHLHPLIGGIAYSKGVGDHCVHVFHPFAIERGPLLFLSTVHLLDSVPVTNGEQQGGGSISSGSGSRRT